MKDVLRKMTISEQTFYRWKRLYGGLGPSEVRRLRQLEEKSRWLKQMVADLSLDKHMLQGRVPKKALRPVRRRALVERLREEYRVGERRACRLALIGRSSYQHRPTRGRADYGGVLHSDGPGQR